MKIYTKTGDAGKTGLYSGERVAKFDARIDVCGTLDELNCHLGSALACEPSEEVALLLKDIQILLFQVAADFSTTFSEKKTNRISENDIRQLESVIDSLWDQLSPLRAFVLPGGTQAASQIHLARTVCRRAERLAFALAEKEETNPLACRFLNRLSDALFCIARRENQLSGREEPLWHPKKQNVET